jgi:uncharacterized membrane protein YsdA (DUF1294 family)/cold shock CspA family protein
MQGRLISWKADKGFGFIQPDGGGKDVFVHLRDFGNIGRAPRVGDVIRFQRVSDGTGRYRAAGVTVSGSPRKVNQANRRSSGPSQTREIRVALWRWFMVGGFAATLLILTVMTSLPLVVLPIYLLASLIALMLYAFDKAAAMNRRWRTTEATLWLAGVLGGWPGALLAQGMFRHKARKVAFLVPFWISVAANCAFLAWASSDQGAEAIRSLIY